MAVYRNRAREAAERLVKLRDYLYTNATPTYAVKAKDMLAYLESIGHKVEIKTLYSDLNVLTAYFGLDLQYDGRQRGYVLNNPPFEPYELRSIVNSIQTAKFITQQEADRLTQKIIGLADKYTRPSLNRQTYVYNRVRSIKEELMKGLDTIYEAIAQDRKISYKYFKYTVTNHKKLKDYQIVNDSTIIAASPYKVVWRDERFNIYAIQKIRKDIYIEQILESNSDMDEDESEEYIDDYEFENMDDTGQYIYDFCILDLEQMEQIEVYPEKREGSEIFEKYFNCISKSTKILPKTAKLKVNNMYITDVINKFGNEVSISPAGHTFSIATINEEPTPELYIWMREFCPPIEIVFPENAEAELREFLVSLLNDDDPTVQLMKEVFQMREGFYSSI